MLKGRSILLIITGGIAAYKTPELVRLFKKAGAAVKIVLTPAATKFVSPLTLAALSQNKVYTDLFALDDGQEMGHIELSRAADIIVVAPATANIMAKAAQGLADDLASTLLLATDKRVMMAPAMNMRMWLHPATQRNYEQLQQDGILFVDPNDGEMACGEFGPGRMAEPMEIVSALITHFTSPAIPMPAPAPVPELAAPSTHLRGKHVLITAGPTHEPIDPVRYIANRSSGKQGYALAEAAREAGARVTLVSGPVALPPPANVTCILVETALEMEQAVEDALPADLAIFAAAVADWRVAEAQPQKIKKNEDTQPSLQFIENPDILAKISRHPSLRPRLVVGFAAETEHVLTYAEAKRKRKGCDVIVANDVSPASGVMGGDYNQVHIISDGASETWPEMDKKSLAHALIKRFAEFLA